jgi:hypothetical protein
MIPQIQDEIRHVTPYCFLPSFHHFAHLFLIDSSILLYFAVYILHSYCFVCLEPAISLHSHHVSLVQWTTRLLPVMRDPRFNHLRETGILLLALSYYISDPDMIDYCSLV